MMETSYSSSSVASWPHCFRMLMASDWLVPWRRIPSMLSSRSPGLMVPSLEREREGEREREREREKEREISNVSSIQNVFPPEPVLHWVQTSTQHY